MVNIINRFNSTFQFKLIYIMRINDNNHLGCLKIGEATVKTQKSFEFLTPNCQDLNIAAKKRIDSYTSTAGIKYELLHTELAVRSTKDSNNKNKTIAFRDYKVHEVLKRSGIKSKFFDTNKKQNEWFYVDLKTALKGIEAVKENSSSIKKSSKISNKLQIIFRPEQLDAIKRTKDRFKTHKRILWNAKMRFGKTLTSLQVAKEMGFKKTIIITHKPVVSDGWFEDFDKIFNDSENYYFGSKNKGKTFYELLESKSNFVYFASMQDLRGSDTVGGIFDKNNQIFKTNWDFVVVDEAHEGTTTELGKNVLKAIIKEETYNSFVLELSGTPFNLLSNFENESIYTWDYVMEQEAKNNWLKNNFGDSNPYEELPRMNIFTYHLEKNLPVYIDVQDKAFNFREFFRVWTEDIVKDLKPMPDNKNKGDFVHEEDIIKFLNLITKEDDKTNYPFSTQQYREFFRHSLWILPGVKEAKAFSKLLKNHKIFSNFKVVNVAGDGDEEINTKDALNAVRNAITDQSNSTYTITLSCGRLTTGVSVPEWTAVLMLAGAYSTAASQYLQTIFRVQTPANIDGRMKEECYVFDFAPDRTLKMIAESVHLSTKAGAKNVTAEKALSNFLNYCPVIAISDSNMKEYKVSELLQELKKAYADRVARNGFDDPSIYNEDLLKLTESELKDFTDLKKIIGVTKQTKKPNEIDINREGFDDESSDEARKLVEKKKKKSLSAEEEIRLEELNEQRKNRNNAISILRAISIRMPLLIYGIENDFSEDINLDNFSDNIDKLSWEEFMPKDVTKELFKKFSKYYDKDIFVAASRRIRSIVLSADELEPKSRILKIAELLSTFKNPDKETVLTPWKVVNLQLSNTIGGFNFYDQEEDNFIAEPRLVEIENISNNVFNEKSKILEINSKTGLYPLYLAFTLYNKRISTLRRDNLEEKLNLWDRVLKEQLFIICKTPMAKQITKRTLAGFRNCRINMHSFEDLIMQIKDKPEKFVEKITSNLFWKTGGNSNMKFDAIVGNPPYQLMDGGAQSSATPIYNYFMDIAIRIRPNYISLIMPSRWMTAGKGLDKFRDSMIHDTRIRIMHDYFNAGECFTNVDIKGGVCYFLWDSSYKGTTKIYTHYSKEKIIESNRFLAESNENIFVRDANILTIKNKVWLKEQDSFETIVSSRKPYGLPSDFFKDQNKYNLPEISDKKIPNGYEIIGLGKKMNREVKYINKNYPLPKSEGINEVKIFIPESFGNGIMGEGISDPIIAMPGQLCTETFLQIRPLKNEIYAKNIITYMNTKLFRLLVGIIKTTQHGTKNVYSLVPMQDFSEEWTDSKLYTKYKLSKEDINYIESLFVGKNEKVR